MGTIFSMFDSTPENVVADVRTQILTSTDWSRPNAATYPNLVKATCASGAQMAVQLDDAAATSKYMQMGVYRTHDGTTGVDKLVSYLSYRYGTTGGTTDPLHCTVSAGPEHLYISVEGPRAAESNPEGSNGSFQQVLFLGSMSPYFSADTSAAVVCVGVSGSATYSHRYAYVSRNQANTSSWVPARLASMQVPIALASGGTSINALQPFASDGSYYLWPYVVIENDAGLRGRISKLHFAGFNFDGIASGSDPIPSRWLKVSYGGDTYVLLPSSHGGHVLYPCYQAFGEVNNTSGSATYSPIIAVPYSTP